MSPTTVHLNPLQAENGDSDSRIVMDEYFNGKLSLQRVNYSECRVAGPYYPAFLNFHFRPPLCHPSLKETNVSSSLTRKDLICAEPP